MASRLKLHEELCELLGSKNVYFQPPASIKMSYPCIVYSLSGKNIKRANNKAYTIINEYDVITIEYDPDSVLSDKLITHFEMCSFDREYAVDNLNHKSHKLYY